MNEDIVKPPKYEEPTLPTPKLFDLANAFGFLPRFLFRAVPRIIPIKITDDTTSLTTGDGKFIFEITEEFDGAYVIGVRAFVSTASTSGTPTFQVRNITNGQDILSVAITIDQDEFTSDTAATKPVIDTTKNLLKNRDRIAIDCDVAGTGAKGAMVYLTLQ